MTYGCSNRYLLPPAADVLSPRCNYDRRERDAGREGCRFRVRKNEDGDMTSEEQTAKQQFDELGGQKIKNPLERLRFFCSLAMNSQDWLDVEPFFDDLQTIIATDADDAR